MILLIAYLVAIYAVAKFISLIAFHSQPSKNERVEQALFNAEKLAERRWYFREAIITPDGIIVSLHSFDLTGSERESVELLLRPLHRSIQLVQSLRSFDVVGLRICTARVETSVEFADYLQIVRY